MNKEIKKQKKEQGAFVGLFVPPSLKMRIALFADAMGSTKSGMMRAYLREYFNDSSRVAEMRTRELQKYQIRWENYKIENDISKRKEDEAFQGFVHDMAIEMRLFGIGESDIQFIVKRLRK